MIEQLLSRYYNEFRKKNQQVVDKITAC